MSEMDIVDKLNGGEVLNINTCREAANEIESLRAQLEAQSGNVVAYTDHNGCLHGTGETIPPSTMLYMAPPAAKVPEGWRLLPEDLVTHIGDWRMACRIALEQPNQTFGDACYWKHQLKTLGKIEAMLSAQEVKP